MLLAYWWLPCQTPGERGSVFGMGRPGVDILRLGEVAPLISSFYVCVAAPKLVYADLSPRRLCLLLNWRNSHVHHKLKLAPSPTCPFGQEDQTTEHVLQRWPLHKATREDVWPVSTQLTTALYGCRQELEKTTSFISRVALTVYSLRTQRRRRSSFIDTQQQKNSHLQFFYTDSLWGCFF